jgi:ZZ-type zinc finger-containing protein 3
VYDSDKPVSFNRLWTEEEQRRLEQLLEEHGEEEVASHRWAKIARALGNRTPKQVASRTQKYFQKLQRLHLPIPGRVDHSSASSATASGTATAPDDSSSVRV